MIENIAKEFFHSVTFRYASQQDSIKVLEEMALHAETSEEMLDFLRDRHKEDSLGSLLDKPFEAKPQLIPLSTRFSDGTIRVFYSALEVDTAEVEAREWYLKHAFGNANEPRTVYYMSFSCNYAGATKDLRRHIETLPPCLIQDEAEYSDCHRIAIEAIKDEVHGLLTPSARKSDGTCLPVFKREALSEPRRREWVAFRHDPATGLVTASRAS